LEIVEDGAVLVREGLIAAVGTRAEMEKLPEARQLAENSNRVRDRQ